MPPASLKLRYYAVVQICMLYFIMIIIIIKLHVSFPQAILTSLFLYVVHPLSFHLLFSFTISFTCVIL